MGKNMIRLGLLAGFSLGVVGGGVANAQNAAQGGPNEPPGNPPSFTSIDQAVQNELAELPKADDVSATTSPTGVVTLTGTVASDKERTKVLNTVGATNGVERLKDEIEVSK